jgi:hypothetical protein
MKNTGAIKSLILSFLLNLFLSFRWSIPGWILLALHFIFGISVWWSVAAFAVWILLIVLGMTVIGLASKCSVPDPPKENKNPYSADNGKLFGNH